MAAADELAALHDVLREALQLAHAKYGIMVRSIDVEWLEARSAISGTAQIQSITIDMKKVF